MEPTARSDEGEPAGLNAFSIKRFSLFFLSLLFFASCHEKKDQTVNNKPPVDSALIKQRQKHRIDSLAIQAATAVKKKRKIYLTFDDGPNRGTQNVLQAVKEDSVPVSFFIVGKHVYDSPEQKATWELLKADTAVELCNHSYSHASNHYSSFYQHPDKVVADIQHNQELLTFSNNVVRMPGRNAWRIDSVTHTDIKESKEAIDEVRKAGFSIMGWDVEWMFDHKTLTPDPDTDLLLRRIQNMLESNKTRLPGNIVVLAHDQSFQKQEDIDKLHHFLQQLKNNPDYELLLAGNYPGVRKPAP
jgi:peptidoglycan-N-acetylglucosamine deacetylase